MNKDKKKKQAKKAFNTALAPSYIALYPAPTQELMLKGLQFQNHRQNTPKP